MHAGKVRFAQHGIGQQGRPFVVSGGLSSREATDFFSFQTHVSRRYILHPDYRELVRRLPEGAGQPSGDNTVQLGGLERAQGQEQVEVEAAETKAEEGGGEKQAQEGSPAGAPKRRNRRLAEDSAPKDQQQQQQQQQQPKGPSLAATAEAAKQKDGPHILFLDAIPDLTPGSWPEEGEADKGWKDWVQQCNWAREDPPKQDRRRRLAERERHQQGAARLRQQRDQAMWQAGQRHVESERSDL